jgi:hypothetical protein
MKNPVFSAINPTLVYYTDPETVIDKEISMNLRDF